MAGAAVEFDRARPEPAARLLVERDHRGLFAAGRADEPVAVDRHALAVAPGIPLRAAELRLEVDAKELLAVGRAACHELAERRDHVDGVAIDRRRAAGALPGFLAVGPGLAGLRLPERLARRAIEAGEVFVGVARGGEAVAERVDAAIGDREARIAAAGAGSLPHERRAFRRPVGEQAGVGRDGRAVGPAECRPVGGASLGGEHQGGKGEQRGKGEQGTATR
jgi:hypothetical protein